ncbi:MAG: helix-turn-helix transcriptional regulator [Acidobacteria bacterium]|nr:helix-turn-helix transcriptional regulator [Acidobacteriota bacterium]
MIPERPALERRVLAAIEATPPRIPVLLGGCGSGRTSGLLRLRDRIGRTSCQYIDLERIATTPERFLNAILDASPFSHDNQALPASATARDAFDRALGFFHSTRAGGGAAATFLLDEMLELRTFESFPGLRTVLRDLLAALPGSSNRFVLTSRYVTRAHRLLRDASPQFEVIHVPPLGAPEVRTILTTARTSTNEGDRDDLARAVHTLADGRPDYVRAIVDMMADVQGPGGSDPISALSALMGPGGTLAAACRFRYELRLHRARGYGALKAILDVLADAEPLTLTEIAQRLRRTPGSTKDYLSWLEDVDLVSVRQKRYSFTDPLLRLWVRLHCRPVPVSDEDLAREIHAYALARLPQQEPEMALAGVSRPDEGPAAEQKPWGIIEID